jgi:UDP-N-acetylglucosamine--N-acetylmuramyl-(pentapeptide) pyrophosphoryl-undecaprenol N-acetylglucosamine transferase
MKLKNNTILLVGGGTGGHAVPILGIYNKLKSKNKNLKIIVIGSGAPMERDLFKSVETYRILKTGKFRRHSFLLNVKEFVFLLCGMVQGLFIIIGQKPKLVFSKGGYVSFPVIFWAKILKIPYFVHESDVESGLSNTQAFKGAKKIFLGFPLEYYKESNLPIQKAVYSGPILRSDFLKNSEKDFKLFGFSSDRPTIFVTGGSQGSLSINKCFSKIVPDLLLSYNVIHQTGGNDFGWVRDFKKSLDEKMKNSYYVTDFLSTQNGLDLMTVAINLSDLVIARAGANTISELATKKKPMILIPYKYAAGDHQTKNAEVLEKVGGAVVLTDDNLSPKLLLDMTNDVIKDKNKLEILSHNAYNFFAGDGLDIICDEIIKEVNR